MSVSVFWMKTYFVNSDGCIMKQYGIFLAL